ncbi:MAG: DUF4834 family protein [Rikenellaceae bacterium]
MLNLIKDNLFLWFILFLLIVSPSFLFGAIGVVVFVVLLLVLLISLAGIYLRWKIAKAQGKAQGYNQGYTQGYAQEERSQQQRREASGEPRVKIVITDDESAATDKKVSKDVGDYVDFEEIKK